MAVVPDLEVVDSQGFWRNGFFLSRGRPAVRRGGFSGTFRRLAAKQGKGGKEGEGNE